MNIPNAVRHYGRVLLTLLVALAVEAPPLSAQSQFMGGPWVAAADFGGGENEDLSCVTSDGFMYCLTSNFTGEVYYAAVTPSGVGTWRQTARYPNDNATPPNCVAAGGYIYCVGGVVYNRNNTINGEFPTWDATRAVGYAKLSPSGGIVGGWDGARNWGDPGLAFTGDAFVDGFVEFQIQGISASSCVTDNAFIHCVGGKMRAYINLERSQASNFYLSQVLSAPISSAGVGPWSQSPNRYGGGGIGEHSCVAYTGYIYCVGGTQTDDNLLDTPADTNGVWYAPLSPDGGVGPWIPSRPYPRAVSRLSCVAMIGNIVCTGGEPALTYAAQMSPSGVGPWELMSSYPESPMNDHGCVSAATTIYCAGGWYSNGTIGDNIRVGRDIFASGKTKGVYYSTRYSTTRELNDSSSCSALFGTFQAGGICVLSRNTTIDAGVTLQVGNAITLVVEEGQTLTIDGKVTNSGEMQVSGNLVNNGEIDNSGFISVKFGGAFTNNGSVDNVDNAGLLQNSGIFTNNGDVSIYAGVLDNSGQLTNNVDITAWGGLDAGRIVNRSSGSILTSGPIDAANDPETVINDGTVTIILNDRTCASPSSSPFIIEGTWSSNTCTSFVMSDSFVWAVTVGQGYILQVPPGVTLVNRGRFEVPGRIENLGTIVNEAPTLSSQPLCGPPCVSQSGQFYIDNQFVNAGVFVNRMLGRVRVSGAFDNGGVINIQTGARLGVGGTLTNAGTINIDASGGMDVSGTLTNSGTVFNEGIVNSRLSLTALIENVGAGSIVNLASGTTNGSGGTITGSLAGTQLDLDGPVCQGFGGTWTVASSRCIVSSNLILDGATLLNIPAGAVLENLQYSSVSVYGAVRSRGVIVNHGLLEIGFPAGVLTVEGGGTLWNFGLMQANATFENKGLAINSSLARFINRGRLDNSGNLTNYGTLRNDIDLVNTGMIEDSCGGVTSGNGTFTGTPVLTSPCDALPPLEPVIVTLTASPNPSSTGQAVTLSVVLSPDQATGAVTFFDGSTTLGELPLGSARATLTTTAIGAGLRSLTAQYSGDGFRAPSISSPVNQTVSTQGSVPVSVVMADVDNDATLDLAVANFASGTVSVLRGGGDGAFEQIGSYNVGSKPIFLVAADFDSDGRVDLAVARNSGLAQNLIYLGGNGDGTFKAPVSYDANLLPRSLAVADFNNDGRLDIVVGNQRESYVSVLYGDSNGGFAATITLTTSTDKVWAVAAGDFNGDGRADIAVSHDAFAVAPMPIDILLGRADGTFLLVATPQNALSGVQSLAVGDFNNDGRLDIAATDFYVSPPNYLGLGVFLGNGNGTFQPPTLWGGLGSPTQVVAADVNGDGNADLLSANGGGTVSLLLGRGDGAFDPERTFTVGANPLGLAAGDVNGSGQLDLVATGENPYLSIVLDPIPMPDLTVTKKHYSEFRQGQMGASYTIYVTNSGSAPTRATVSVTDVLPAGLSAAGIGGDGWSCALSTLECQRSDVLPAGNTYSPILLMVDVAPDAPSNVTNVARVSGGGESLTANNSAPDWTAIAARPVLTVTAADATRPYGEANPSFAGAIVGLQPGFLVTATYASAANASSAPGRYDIVPTLSDPSGVLVNYTVKVVNGTLTVTPAPASISVNSADRVYGQPNPGFDGTVSGILPGDGIAVSYASAADATSPAGPYDITPIVNDPAGKSGNYTLAIVKGTLTVTPAILSVKANDASRGEGEANPIFTATLTGFVNGDTAASLSGTLTLQTPATPSSSAGSYPITPSGVSSLNYVIAFIPGTLTIGNDRTPPIVAITAPGRGARVGGAAVTIAASASDNVAVAGVQFRIDGVVIGPEIQTLPYAVTWDTTGLPEGIYRLTAVARDTSGNHSLSPVVGVVVSNDLTPPTVQITAPANGNITNERNVVLIASAADNIAVAGVQFKLNGVDVGGEDRSAPYSVSWNTRSYPGGVYQVTAVARDLSGNRTTSPTVEIIVDIEHPDVSIASPMHGATVAGTVYLTAEAHDNVEVAGVRFKIDGVDFGVEDTTSPYTIAWDSTQVSDGRHKITAVARDAAGNPSQSSVTVNIDNEPTGNGSTQNNQGTIAVE